MSRLGAQVERIAGFSLGQGKQLPLSMNSIPWEQDQLIVNSVIKQLHMCTDTDKLQLLLSVQHGNSCSVKNISSVFK